MGTRFIFKGTLESCKTQLSKYWFIKFQKIPQNATEMTLWKSDTLSEFFTHPCLPLCVRGNLNLSAPEVFSTPTNRKSPDFILPKLVIVF